ncbi:MAG: amidohydrolase family protein [Chloroflexia bacterium]
MFQDLHVIDFHAHFPIRGDITEGGHRTREPAQGTVGAERDAARRAQLRRYQEQWRLAWDFPEPEREPRSTEEQAARWAAEVERHGLDRVVFVTGRDNDELARAVALHPDKFVGLAHHDITRPDAAAELERAATQLGLRGYKMLAPTIDMPLHDRALYPVWEVCERLGLPVLIHFGMLGGAGGVSYHPNITPAVLEPVARDFPTVDFVVPHFGIQYVTDLLFLCWSCPNVHVDTSGSNQWVRWMPYKLTLDDLFQRFIETIGPERILFGTDSSWFPRGFALRYLQDQLRICRFMGLSHEQLQLIFGGNARRLLGL